MQAGETQYPQALYHFSICMGKAKEATGQRTDPQLENSKRANGKVRWVNLKTRGRTGGVWPNPISGWVRVGPMSLARAIQPLETHETDQPGPHFRTWPHTEEKRLDVESKLSRTGIKKRPIKEVFRLGGGGKQQYQSHRKQAIIFLNTTLLFPKISGSQPHRNKQQKSIKVKSNKSYYEEKENKRQNSFYRQWKHIRNRVKLYNFLLWNQLEIPF